MRPSRHVDIARILAAPRHIDPVFQNSPLFQHPALDAVLGCEVVNKVETLNPIRSFKGRGAELYVATELRAGETSVSVSAGNFGQGLAYAANRRGYECIVFASENANAVKVEAMRRLGADVRLVGADFDQAKEAAREFAHQRGFRFVEDAARVPVPEALALLDGLYDSIVAVTEEQIVNAMQLTHQHLGLVLEPAGAVGIAAIAADPHRFHGKRIATILTGGNLSDALRPRLIG